MSQPQIKRRSPSSATLSPSQGLWNKGTIWVILSNALPLLQPSHSLDQGCSALELLGAAPAWARHCTGPMLHWHQWHPAEPWMLPMLSRVSWPAKLWAPWVMCDALACTQVGPASGSWRKGSPEIWEWWGAGVTAAGVVGGSGEWPGV